jgi:hypothetical protein
MQARDHLDALWWQRGQGGVLAIGAVTQENVAQFEFVPQAAQEAQVMMMQVAQQDVEHGAAGQGEEHHEFH